MNRGKRWLSLVLALVLLVACASYALADAGSFSGDSDYGGSWDSGSDWSSSDWDSDSNWSSSSDSYYYDDDGDSEGGGGWLGIAIALVIIYLIIKGRGGKGGKGGGKPVAPGASYSTPKGENIGLDGLKAKDPDFSEQAFLEDVSNRYTKLQNAWMDQDWEPMRMLLTDALYSQMERQLNVLKGKGYVNKVERICVLGAKILGCWEDEVNQTVTVELRTRIVDYTVDSDGKVVQGDPNRELFMTYEWTMIRSKDATTASFSGERRTACPACGAPVLLNASNRCEYCGSLLSASEHGWVLSAIRGISQRSGN